ncbi:MAG: porin family protein [Bacteroidia bacterium]
MAIYRTIGLLLGMIMLTVTGMQAQRYNGKHPKDFNDFNLGFQIGMHYASYNFTQQLNIRDQVGLGFETKTLNKIEMLDGPGIIIGMILNYNLTNQLSLRSYPAVSLEQRDFDFYFAEDAGPTRRRVTTAYGQIPLLLTYKTPYYEKYRFYILGGPQFNIQPSNSKKVLDNQDLLKTDSYDYGLTFGFGMQLYGDRIKLSPEIRFFLGLKDVFVRENTSHGDAINNMASQLLTLSVNFE